MRYEGCQILEEVVWLIPCVWNGVTIGMLGIQTRIENKVMLIGRLSTFQN